MKQKSLEKAKKAEQLKKALDKSKNKEQVGSNESDPSWHDRVI